MQNHIQTCYGAKGRRVGVIKEGLALRIPKYSSKYADDGGDG